MKYSDSSAFFDPETDGKDKKLLKGVFPAHVLGLRSGSFDGSIPYNLELRIAPEAALYTGIDIDTNKVEQGDMCVGLTVTSKAFWFNPNPQPDKRRSNKRYADLLTELDIELEKKKDPTTGKEMPVLGALEDTDILGKPVFADIRVEYDKRDLAEGNPKDKCRTYLKAAIIRKWEEGTPIPMEEILEERNRAAGDYDEEEETFDDE